MCFDIAAMPDQTSTAQVWDTSPYLYLILMQVGRVCASRKVWSVQVPKKWREELRERQISTGRSKLHHSVTAADGTRKFLLQLHDGLIVEAVGIPADDADKSRLTACVSSQVTASVQE